MFIWALPKLRLGPLLFSGTFCNGHFAFKMNILTVTLVKHDSGWYSDGNHGKYWWNMMKFRCLSNGLCSLKNCHKPFGQGFRLPTHLGNAQIDTYFLIVGLPLNLYCKKIWIQSFSIHQHVVKCFGQNNWNVNDPRAELQNIRALVTFSRPCLHCFPDGLLI